MLKYLYILNGRKILFFNLTQASSHCLTSPPSLPTTLSESYLQILITSQSSPAFWILPLSFLITPLITPLKWVLLDHSNPMIFIQFLFQTWSLNNTRPLLPPFSLGSQGQSSSWPLLGRLLLCSRPRTDGILESWVLTLYSYSTYSLGVSSLPCLYRLMTPTMIAEAQA